MSEDGFKQTQSVIAEIRRDAICNAIALGKLANEMLKPKIFNLDDAKTAVETAVHLLILLDRLETYETRAAQLASSEE